MRFLSKGGETGLKQRRPAVKLAVGELRREQRAARRFSDYPLFLILTPMSEVSSGVLAKHLVC